MYNSGNVYRLIKFFKNTETFFSIYVILLLITFIFPNMVHLSKIYILRVYISNYGQMFSYILVETIYTT